MIEKVPSSSKKIKISHHYQSLIIESLVNSTAHALPNIIKTDNKIIKLMWAFFLVLSSVLCSYSIVQAILDYLSFEVITKTRTIFDDDPIYFPSIKICNKNIFTTESDLQLAKDIIKQNNLTDIFNKTVMNKMSLNMQKNIINDFYTFAFAKFSSSNFSDSDRKNLGLQLKDILFECRYNFDQCSYKDFFWEFDPVRGNCFKFNYGKDNLGNPLKIKTSIKEGKIYGFSVTIFAGILNELKKLSSEIGITLLIDNNTYPVMDIIDANGITLGTGFEFSLGLDRVYHFQMPNPYSECENDNVISKSNFYDILMKQKRIYKRSDCISLCFQKNLANVCNCTDYLSQSGIDVELCKSQDELDCLKDFYFKNFSSDNYISKNCYPLCPMECKKTDYKVSISFSRLIPETYFDYFETISQNLSILKNEKITLDLVRDNLLKVNIYYNSLSYTVISEIESTNIVSLLSNLGGTLGLFLGVSVLSFVELIEFLLKILIK